MTSSLQTAASPEQELTNKKTALQMKYPISLLMSPIYSPSHKYMRRFKKNRKLISNELFSFSITPHAPQVFCFLYLTIYLSQLCDNLIRN